MNNKSKEFIKEFVTLLNKFDVSIKSDEGYIILSNDGSAEICLLEYDIDHYVLENETTND